MTRPINPADYLSEADVLARWPMLAAKELRRARKNQLIEFYGFRNGPCYTAEQVQSYLDRTYLRGAPCAAPEQQPDRSSLPAQSPPPLPMTPLKSADFISTARTPAAADSSTPAGMTPALVSSAVDRLAQRIGKRPKSSSLPLSSPRPPAGTGRSPVLVKS